MGLPDLVIAGAPRSGTSWLYAMLGRLDSIHAPDNKEPRFYALPQGASRPEFVGPGDDNWVSNFVDDPDEYASLYAHAGTHQLRIDGSTDYLMRSGVAAERIYEGNPEALLVFIFRQPAERAYSNWTHLTGLGFEHKSFEGALASESDRADAGWAWWWRYRERGFYADQLEPFLDVFPREQIRFFLYEQVVENPFWVLTETLRFVGLDPAHADRVPLGQKVNRSRAPIASFPVRVVYKAYNKFLRPRLSRAVDDRIEAAARRVGQPPAAMSANTATQLTRRYRRDLERLEVMLGKPLSAWF